MPKPPRHELMLRPLYELMEAGAEGEPGVAFAIRELRTVFSDLAGKDRTNGEFEAEQEFNRMFSGAGDYLLERGASVVEDFLNSVPIPLATEVAVPAFPADSFPPVVADMVKEVARATQTAPAMAGTCALSALAAANGGAVKVEVNNGWREGLNLYTGNVAFSGERKSAALDFMTAVISEVERVFVEAAIPEKAQADADREVAEKRLKTAIGKAAKEGSTSGDRQDARDYAAALAAMPVLPLPRLVSDDATPEAMVSLMAEQNGRIAALSAEGGIFDIIGGRYSNNVPNIDAVLKGHSGDEIRIDRKGRPPEFIRKPALTIGLMFQPDVLTAIAARGSFRGRGLLARFLYALPVSYVGYRDTDPEPPDAEVWSAYNNQLRALVRAGAQRAANPVVLTLSPEASRVLADIAEEVEPMLRAEGQLADLKDWGSKFVGAIARIGGNLHMAELGAEEALKNPVVSAETMRHAAEFGEYYKFAAIKAWIY